MTIYYNPHTSPFRAILAWKGTIFNLVLSGREFWIYVAAHALIVTLFVFIIKDQKMPEFEWEAAAAMQYFMTFFVTFYNDKCYERCMTHMYPACCEFVDACVLFTQEMNIYFWHDSMRLHRLAAAKYLLAAVYEYFMCVTSGRLTVEGWQELMTKGLLSKVEASMLAEYPGENKTNVLATWVLLIVKDGFLQDHMWRERSQQTSHVYYRINKHIIHMQQRANQIGYMMAMPIPFAYFHLMNVILVFNILLLAIIPALFRNYLSVPLFAMAILIIMGIKGIATSLADPFGEDEVDFDVPVFAEHAFDRVVCMLESYISQEVRALILSNVPQVTDFNDEQLARQVDADILYDDVANTKSAKTVYNWVDPTALQRLYKEEDLVKRLHEWHIHHNLGIDEGDEVKEPPWVQIERDIEQEQAKEKKLTDEINGIKQQLEKHREQYLGPLHTEVGGP